jgi:glycosyltransferase XagB
MAAGGSTSENANVRLVVAAPDQATVDAARLGFHRAYPRRSAKYTLTGPQAVLISALAAGAVWAALVHPGPFWRAAHDTLFVLFALTIFWRLIAAFAPQRPPAPLYAPADGRWPLYTVLCPVYREANVVADLIGALERIDYPRDALDIQILVEADDVDTILAAIGRSTARHVRVVMVPAAEPRTKPKALNVGLARARGEYLVVYDAEDRPHPTQLRAALGAFAQGGPQLACVQAPLAIDNARAAWISSHFAAEYAIQFGQILPFLARLGLPLPLGGTSNHFRVDALRASGGWDPFNVTEDADLGYRLAREGWRCGVIEPATWEEAPITLKAWISQRTRWIKGHMQTWLVLMREPFKAMREMGVLAFLSLHLVLGAGFAAAFLHAPLAFMFLVALLTPYGAIGPADLALAACGYAAAMLAAARATARCNDENHARAALTMAAYWPLASIAALRALAGLMFRPHSWTKTTHGVSLRAAQHFTVNQGAVAEADAPAVKTARRSA